MNLNHYDAIQLVQKLSYLITKDDVERVDVSLHPPFTDIRTVQTSIESDRLPFFLGAQNCHSDDSGAFTGEVVVLAAQPAATPHREPSDVAAVAADAAGGGQGVTAVPTRPREQTAVAAVAAIAAAGDGDRITAGAAIAEPARVTAVAAVVAGTAVAQDTAVAAVARTGGAAVDGVGEAVARQQPGVGMISGAVADEHPQDAARLPGRRRS